MSVPRNRAATMAALLLLSVSCSTQPPSPSVAPTATPATPTPATPTAAPSSEPPGPLQLAINDIPTRFTTPALAYETDGQALFWSSGVSDGPTAPAADLWVYSPGSGEPTRVFANPNRDSSLIIIRGDGSGHYAFVEQNERLYGSAGWRLWYLAAPNEQPELIDEGDVEEGLLPFMALSADRIVWAILHQTDAGVMSQLIELDLATGRRSVLQEADAVNREFLYPSLRGDQLAFTTIDANAARTALSSAVWLMDLSDQRAGARQISPSGSDAFMGVIGPGIVVWQTPALDNPFNGGRLVLYDVATGETISLGIGGSMVTWHTVGDRFVVAETEDITVKGLFVYDLATRMRRLADEESSGPEGTREAVDHRPRVSGDLLVFVRGSDVVDTELVLKWAELPQGELTGAAPAGPRAHHL